jgi:hypothetical protein
MAELNFGLLTPPGSQPIGNAFVSGMDQAQAARLQDQQLQQTMQQNALAKVKMAEYERGVAEQNALRNRMTQPGFDINNPQHQQDILNIAPMSGQAILQHAATMAKTGAETARFGAQTEEARVKTAKAQQEWNNQALRDLIPNPSDDNLRAWGQDAVIKGIYSLAEANRLVNSYLKIPVEQRADTFKQVGAPAAAPQQPRQPNFAADLLIPGPNGTMVPNTALIGVKTGLAAAGRPTGTTVVMPPLEKTEQQEKGKFNVKVYGDIAGTADRARKILPALETSEAILNNGFKTGFGTDVQTQAARVLSSLGVPEADKYATNSQLFLAQGRQALLQRQLEQKGAQSEGDAQRINQTFIQLGNTPEANKFLVATAKAQAKQDIERQKFYSDWWSKSKTYEGAEEAWLAGTGGKSLFDRPDMKSFAPKTPQSDIRSRADAIIKGTP